ncbi:MAG: gluconate 2-dehydrogenase subunit 3 family protein [Ferruginibacter sp.]
MNRRNAINSMVILSIGAAVFPGCSGKDDTVIKLKNFSLAGCEGNMLSQLTETIIPKTNFIGAADVNAHEFTLLMVDDCYEPERQKKFTNGLKEFDKQVKNKYGNSFISCSPVQKKEWLTALESKKDIPEEVIFFYETAKRHTVQAFTSSREYMTGILKYNIIPGGDFKGCVPVKKA